MYCTRTDKDKGRIPCPLHHGRNNNFSYSTEQFKCWSCGEQGNVISFVAKLFGMSNAEAAQKIDTDFNLGIWGQKPTILAIKKAKDREYAEAVRKRRRAKLEARYDELATLHRLLFRHANGRLDKETEDYKNTGQIMYFLNLEMDKIIEELDNE